MSRTHCLDCDVPLKPFKLVDATHGGWGDARQRYNLKYAPQDAEFNFFGGIEPTGMSMHAYARSAAAFYFMRSRWIRKTLRSDSD